MLAVSELTYQLRKNKRLVLLVFKTSFILYYFFVPLLLLLFKREIKAKNYVSPYLKTVIASSDREQIMALLIAVVTYIVIIMLQRVVLKGSKRVKIEQATGVAVEKKINERIYDIGVGFVVLGSLGAVILFNDLGGLSKALSMGTTIRAFVIDSSEYISAIGMIGQTVAEAALVGCFLVFATKQTSVKSSVILGIGFVFSLLFLLFSAGRAPILVFVGCFAFYYLKKYCKNIVWMVVCAFALLVVTSSSIEDIVNNVASGLPMFNNFSYSLTDNVIATIADLSYPYANVLNLSKFMQGCDYRYGIDYILWIFEILPARLFMSIGITLPTYKLATQEITSYYVEIYQWNGGTPADYITFGWLQGGFIGIIVNNIIFISVIKYIDAALSRLTNKYRPLIYRFAFLGYSFITSGDFTNIVYSNLFLLLAAGVILYTKIKAKVQYDVCGG